MKQVSQALLIKIHHMPPQSFSLPHSRSFYHWCNILNIFKTGFAKFVSSLTHIIRSAVLHNMLLLSGAGVNITVDLLSCISMLNASPSLLSIQIIWTKLNIHACRKAAMVQLFQIFLPVKTINKKKLSWIEMTNFLSQKYFSVLFLGVRQHYNTSHIMLTGKKSCRSSWQRCVTAVFSVKADFLRLLKKIVDIILRYTSIIVRFW